jgi:hypothetical protein
VTKQLCHLRLADTFLGAGSITPGSAQGGAKEHCIIPGPHTVDRDGGARGEEVEEQGEPPGQQAQQQGNIACGFEYRRRSRQKARGSTTQEAILQEGQRQVSFRRF